MIYFQKACQESRVKVFSKQITTKEWMQRKMETWIILFLNSPLMYLLILQIYQQIKTIFSKILIRINIIFFQRFLLYYWFGVSHLANYDENYQIVLVKKYYLKRLFKYGLLESHLKLVERSMFLRLRRGYEVSGLDPSKQFCKSLKWKWLVTLPNPQLAD